VSISPPSDIVLGVANAADPEKYRAALAQLQRLRDGVAAAAATDNAATAQFTVPPMADTKAASDTASKTAPASSNSAALSASGDASSSAQTGTPDRELNAYKQLEAFLMRTFIETMLPKDATSVYGTGTAGDIWRSMLAEHTANEVTKASALGIAESLMKGKGRLKKSLTTATVPSNASAPGGLNASLFQLQTSTGSNAQAAAIASSAASRRGS
jgi:peptidoglycan hydrolase FlgJ